MTSPILDTFPLFLRLWRRVRAAPVDEQIEAWLSWCRRHRACLADEFLRSVEAGEPVNRFFGSWLEIDGYAGTGYFLGEEIVAAWEPLLPLSAIAALPLEEIERRAHGALEALAGDFRSGRSAANSGRSVKPA